MSNVGQNTSTSSATFNSPELSTEKSQSPSSAGDTNPTSSQPNVVVEDSVSKESSSSKLKSIVWEHFKKEKINNEWKAVCNYCKKKFSGNSKNGTSHLRDHMRRCNKRGQVDIRQQVLVANQRKSDGKVTVKAASFNQDVARRELSKAIIMHEYPLSIVDHVQFRKYCFNLQPLFEMPSRKTVRRDIFDIFEEGKMKTMSMLEATEGRIAITTDMWTADHQNKGYMAVTAHYIDYSWTLQKRIIRFEYVPAPHTADVIASTLMKCFLDWNIDRKLTCITVDNCTTNDLTIRLLVDKLGGGTLLLNGSFFHMRCCAHILHLIVKDGMNVLGSGIERIRQSVIFWSATPKRWERFEEAARQLRIPTIKKLCGDVRTRWNSTFLMLRTALPYKDVFSRCVQLHQDPLYKSLPTEDDWVFATEICEKFKLFYDITEGFLGTKYATANIYFPSICKIRVSLNEWKMHTNDTISSMANCMLEKFEKYWGNVNGIMGVATLLDPRYKTPLLEYYFEKIFGVAVAEYEVEKIVQLCRDLVSEYEEKANSSMNYSQSSCATSPSSVPVTLGDQGDFEAYLSRKKQKKLQVKSELDRYLELELLPSTPEFDILNWWKINGPQFPILKNIARDIFAIPISTVASESTFSTGGRLVTAHRNRLLPSTVEALACSQNWLWAEEESNSSEAYFNEDREIEQEEIMDLDD